jgi:hypothetical protein
VPVRPDTVYTETQAWSSINTPTGVYKQGPDQVQKMNHAVATASLETPTTALRVYAPTNVYAQRPLAGMQPTIDDVLGQAAGQPPQMSIFDYSGTEAGMMSSTAPSIPLGG